MSINTSEDNLTYFPSLEPTLSPTFAPTNSTNTTIITEPSSPKISNIAAIVVVAVLGGILLMCIGGYVAYTFYLQLNPATTGVEKALEATDIAVTTLEENGQVIIGDALEEVAL